MIVAVDTREQIPYFVLMAPDCPRVETCRMTLKTGDYSIVDYTDQIAIERKSLDDFWGSITRERRRFEREIQRLAEIPFRAVVVEGTFNRAVDTGARGRKIAPASITGTVASWAVKYGVPFYFLKDRTHAERFTLQFLTTFYKDIAKK